MKNAAMELINGSVTCPTLRRTMVQVKEKPSRR